MNDGDTPTPDEAASRELVRLAGGGSALGRNPLAEVVDIDPFLERLDQLDRAPGERRRRSAQPVARAARVPAQKPRAPEAPEPLRPRRRASHLVRAIGESLVSKAYEV